MPETFKIVAILDDKTVLINAGERNDIKIGDEFNILEKGPTLIKDPDTGEVLEKVQQYKQRIYVQKVEKKYSICVSKYTRTVIGNSLAERLLRASTDQYSIAITRVSVAGDAEKQETVGRKLNIDPNEINDVLGSYSYHQVHAGDQVKLVK